jgi:hypothetical protein
MGNTIATNPQIKESIKEAYTNDKQLFDKILEKSRAIYSRNKEQLGDKELYDRLVITYSNQLYKLPLEKIETIYSQMEGQSAVRNELKPFLELSLKYDGLEEEKYIVNQLTGKIVENFKNKKIPAEVERNGIKLKLPDLYYIHNKVALLLDGIQQRENNKLEQQNGGIYFSPLALSNDGVISPNEMRTPQLNKNNRSIKNAENISNSKFKGGSPMNNFNENRNDPYNGNSENYDSSNSNNGENGNSFNKPKKIRINVKEPQKPPQRQNKKSLSSIEKEIEELEKEKESEQKPANNQQRNNSKNKKNSISPPQQSPAPKSRQIVIPEEDNICSDPTVPCKLTKIEMCVKIVLNLMTRNNIILAILSAIPVPNKNGDYEGSFTFERLTSLKKGRFCAPPPLSDIQSEEDYVRIHKIMRFLNMMDDETCRKSGGVIYELKEKQMTDMLADETFGKKYFEYGNKINSIYQESIRVLLTILEKLESNFTISTNELNEISASVKNTLDELYIKTQLNFLLAVLVVLDFDFDKNPVKDMKIKERIKKISQGTF